MTYETFEKELIMPEYGRNVQKMIEYAITIEDKKERTRCVNAIVDTMGNLFPYLRDVNDFNHKLWDHVAIMSRFQLDIDYPCEIVKEENLYEKPETIPYQNSYLKYKHYGKNLQNMIEKATEYEEGEEKDEFIRLIANQMKKCFLIWNKEVVDNKKILDDLNELSDGKLNPSEDAFQLIDSKSILQSGRKNTRNKKKDFTNQTRRS